ncbi:hypothetical protein [Palleronia caenipelagi]|uniref:FERM domain-containing protein n=1 Tax=Palleronia caenipelagi TaxID=2489174 RepID=A0A547Q8P8_9RHOB|nr:hypothetical protein [Palleronia caenipelagi]TRD22751.1 hypothetical protein FEV53_02910 [Palleronia caenipelagi]
MALIRPELIPVLMRWREAAFGAALLTLGLWWAVTSFGVLRWVGVTLIVAGAAVLRSGILRLMRPGDGGGAGIVTVDERQITYLDGFGGGVLSVEALVSVAVSRSPAGTLRWHFTDTTRQRLTIPTDAEGAERLFDAVVALPGLSEERALSALRHASTELKSVWHRPQPRLTS